MRIYAIILGLVLLSGVPQQAEAQTIPVGMPVLEDYFRQRQLLGEVDSSVSMMVRPLMAAGQGKSLYDEGGARIALLPVVWQNQLNTAYPYGWNDGPMIPARGVQTYLSAGVYAQYKWLSVQFRPEFVAAQNSVYEGYGGAEGPDQVWYSNIGNVMDLPERFGDGAYTRAYWGQSSVRLTLDPVSVGLSTENLYWGPGIRNSIVMGNTAPGFAHVTLNTSKPIKTYVGSFEAQVVGGRLEKSGFAPSLLGDTATHMDYINPKPVGWRYFAGFTFNYQPRWVPGLFLGMSRTFTTNQEDMKPTLRHYMPFFDGLSKAGTAEGGTDEEGIARNQMISFFFRWVAPSAHVEFYGEYAKNDHNWDFRDAMNQLDHSRAYTVGARKLVPLSGRYGGFLQFIGEITQLTITRTHLIRSVGSWYRHAEVRDGYTHRGQLLGAGIGPGSNMQTLQVSWVNGLKQLGIQMERFAHNEDLTLRALKDRQRNWVDIGMGAYGNWDYQRFIFNARMQYMYAYNYEHSPIGRGKSNVHLQLGLMYRF